MTVKSVSESTGLSQRRFIDLFKREVGMTPKLFCRVRRFQDVLAFVRKSKTPDWSEAAYICGYFDQSHLIRDFRIFSGINPTDYALRRTNRVMENHVPVAG
jgi:AraC-like DNA-binding protein